MGSRREASVLLWLILILVALLLLLVFWTLWGPSGSLNRPTGRLTPTTPVAAGAVIPIDNLSLNSFTAADAVEAAARQDPSQSYTQTANFAPNQQVTVIENSDGRSIGKLAMFADADPNALIYNMYEPGTTLTVVEPTGDYQGYPVEKFGISWVRVRDPVGLVGWVDRSILQAKVADGTAPVTDTEAPNSGTTEQFPADVVPSVAPQVPQNGSVSTSTPGE